MQTLQDLQASVALARVPHFNGQVAFLSATRRKRHVSSSARRWLAEECSFSFLVSYPGSQATEPEVGGVLSAAPPTSSLGHSTGACAYYVICKGMLSQF